MNKTIGIVGYGAYIPKYRIKIKDIASFYGHTPESIEKGLLIEEKSVPGVDEDSVTLAVEAGLNALKRAAINPKDIGALFAGSESKVYSVKPNASIISDALKIGNDIMGADLEFACKAGTAAIQICMGLVKSSMISHGLAIGSDTAQSKPGDVLEFSASAGAAAYIIGSENLVAEIEDTCSYQSDTPDFWRRDMSKYPNHAERFTGEPAYFKHTVNAAKGLMKKTGLSNSDFDHVIFHTPNGKFPIQAAKLLGFSKDQLGSLVVSQIGNCYSGSTLIELSNVLDKAKPNERIFVVSFGSGAGSDAFSIKTTSLLAEKQDKAKKTGDYVKRKEFLSYDEYLRHTGGIR